MGSMFARKSSEFVAVVVVFIFRFVKVGSGRLSRYILRDVLKQMLKMSKSFQYYLCGLEEAESCNASSSQNEMMVMILLY